LLVKGIYRRYYRKASTLTPIRNSLVFSTKAIIVPVVSIKVTDGQWFFVSKTTILVTKYHHVDDKKPVACPQVNK
jgi:hypothetical protein